MAWIAFLPIYLQAQGLSILTVHQIIRSGMTVSIDDSGNPADGVFDHKTGEKLLLGLLALSLK
jgi:hypothetical protein